MEGKPLFYGISRRRLRCILSHAVRAHIARACGEGPAAQLVSSRSARSQTRDIASSRVWLIDTPISRACRRALHPPRHRLPPPPTTLPSSAACIDPTKARKAANSERLWSAFAGWPESCTLLTFMCFFAILFIGPCIQMIRLYVCWMHETTKHLGGKQIIFRNNLP